MNAFSADHGSRLAVFTIHAWIEYIAYIVVSQAYRMIHGLVMSINKYSQIFLR